MSLSVPRPCDDVRALAGSLADELISAGVLRCALKSVAAVLATLLAPLTLTCQLRVWLGAVPDCDWEWISLCTTADAAAEDYKGMPETTGAQVSPAVPAADGPTAASQWDAVKFSGSPLAANITAARPATLHPFPFSRTVAGAPAFPAKPPVDAVSYTSSSPFTVSSLHSRHLSAFCGAPTAPRSASHTPTGPAAGPSPSSPASFTVGMCGPGQRVHFK